MIQRTSHRQPRPLISRGAGRAGGTVGRSRSRWLALSALALLGAAAGPGWGQTQIEVSLPSGSATTWSLNNTTYTGADSPVSVTAADSNSAAFQIAPMPAGSNSTYRIQGSGQASSTAMSVAFTNATTNPITTSNYATIFQGVPASGSYVQNPGTALTVSAFGVGAAVTLGAQGGGGFVLSSQGGATGAVNVTEPSGQIGGAGGAISANIQPLFGSYIPYQTSIQVSGQPTIAQSLPWTLASAGILVTSSGGLGSAGSIDAGSDKFQDWAGQGGDGGSVSLSVGTLGDNDPGNVFSIALGTTQDPLVATPQSPVAGIVATSIGAPTLPCCSWSGKQGGPITADSDPSSVVLPIGYQPNGSGAPVDVAFSGLIQGDSPNLYGVVAASVGASTQIPIGLTNNTAPVQASGTSGNVTVFLTDGVIDLGLDSVGIFAASVTDQVIIPSSTTVAGTGNTAGSVKVDLDSYSSVSVGNGSSNGQFSAGIAAISSTGWLFQPIGDPVLSAPVQGAASPGSGGSVTVTNGGAISAVQNSAIGIAALSFGNGGILSNAPGSVETVTYSGTSNSGATAYTTGGSVSVTNNGSVTATGDAAIGILAASNGTGGLIAGIPDAAFTSSTSNDQSIQIGSQSSGFVAGAGDSSTYTAAGGPITISNSGSITTGGGNVAIGILAQSVGGGGATYTGGVALFTGDAGGPGGNGGAITLSNSGTVSTAADGSIGVLGQSIGGGGGQAANTKGLFVAVGGQGGNGGAGGPISATLNAGSTFTTSGDSASGLLLQSIGGGGGNGGFAKAYGLFVSTAIGGNGGAGGAGGDVTLAASAPLSALSATVGDHSHGLLLQSIGGGGGTGGHAYSSAAGALFAGAVSIGGSGATAGDGGSISLCPSGGTACTALSGAISTAGSDAVGVALQSIGGGGGYGGGALADAIAAMVDPELPTISLSTTVGGSAAGGGNAGAINATSGLSITTLGTGSHAILAQSVGGGGGVAADSTAGTNAYDDSDFTLTASVDIGGTGGAGGAGGAVQLTTTPSVLSTSGHTAAGLLAQSIGGGGGYGAIGNAYQNDVSTGEKQVGLTFALGGSGGGGGSGGSVTISNGATVTTVGTHSAGIIAQSISGGGGFGGNAGAQGLGGNTNVNITVGGSGGAGPQAGPVALTNAAAISTGRQLDLASNYPDALSLIQPIVIGGDSPGILAQSIGGGGGIGGNADPSASLINNVNTLLNDGAGDYVNSTGLKDYLSSASGAAPINYNANLAVGGRAGSGGAGNSVTISNSASITTYGHRSAGILAQSIGGGGGTGGSSTASASFLTGVAAFTPLTGFNLGLGINVGGAGGAGGDGGPVAITLAPSLAGDVPQILTTGYAAQGVLAQSIGGGGGSAHDGSVFNFTGTVGLDTAIAVNPSLSIGALSRGGGNQGQGGAVSFGQSGAPSVGGIRTMGDDAAGLVLQSIGGGGGLASFSCTNSGNAAAPGAATAPVTASACLPNISSSPVPGQSNGWLTPSAFQPAAGNQPFTVTLQASSGTGSGSQGGAITLTSGNQIVTQGNRSIGLVAQSIGGGGGYVSAPQASLQSVALPSAGGNQSAGGPVSITLEGASILTGGSGAWGLLAQSIGGGGGFAGDPGFAVDQVPAATPPSLPAGSSGPNGGTIAFQLGGGGSGSPPQILTYGDNAHAVVLQSIGGGGGIANSPLQQVVGGSAGADPAAVGGGGAITATINGDIATFGDQAVGLFAQSTGSALSNNPIALNLGGSIRTYGRTAAPAVVVSGGSTQNAAPNTITVQSTGSIVASQNSAGSLAIAADGGLTDVVNNGLIIGSIDLGSTPGEVTNYGTIETGNTVVVSTNSFRNHGLTRIGPRDSVTRTTLVGSYKQFDSGTLEITVDTSKKVPNDHLAVKGKVVLGGTVVPVVKTLQRGEFEMLSAKSLNVSAAIRDSLLVDWSLRQRGQTLSMVPRADFTPSSLALSNNHQSVAGYLQNAWWNGDGSMAPLFGHLHQLALDQGESYRSLLNQLGGAALNSQPIQMKTAFATAVSESLSCPTLTPQGVKPNQRQCVWARAGGDYSSQASSDTNPGYWVTAPGIRLGGQRDLGNQWTAGLALGYGTNNLRSDGYRSTADVFDAALSLRKQVGAWEFGASLAFAQGWFDNTRALSLPGLGEGGALVESYQSSSALSILGLRARAAYTFKGTHYALKPYIDLDLNQSWMTGFTEKGGRFALRNEGGTATDFAVTPMLEFSLYSREGENAAFKSFFSAGLSVLPGNSVSSPMRFAADSNANGTFDMVADGPTVLARLNAGVEASFTEALNIRAEYNLQAGDGYMNQGLSANLVYRF